MGSIVIGSFERYGERFPLVLADADRRQHLYVVGKTGTGKSTLLRNLLLQDIEAGRGCGLLDPHGDLSNDLLDHIPRWRTRDLVYFDPGDRARPIAFNPLAPVPEDERHLVARGIVLACRHLWADSWGPRLAYILHNAVAALLDASARYGGQTLLALPRLLTEPPFRARVVRAIENPQVRQFWESEFPGYGERLAAEALAPIQNKIGQFVTSPVLRNILGQVRSTIRPSEIMDEGRIFIANLGKGTIGEDDANLLGSLLVAGFQHAAMRRSAIPEEERRDFALVIDEFQSFTTEAFVGIFAEARKYRLSLTVAHQYLDQVPEPIRAAIFGNVGTLVSFRVGAGDAHGLAREFAPYPATTLAELSRGEICVRPTQGGETRDSLIANTLPPLLRPTGCGANMRAQSRARYARRREIVEEKLGRWLRRGSLLGRRDKSRHARA